jgi:hypothetical protein
MFTYILKPITLNPTPNIGPPEPSDQKERWVYKLLATTHQQLQSNNNLSEMIKCELADKLMGKSYIYICIYIYSYIYVYMYIFMYMYMIS